MALERFIASREGQDPSHRSEHVSDIRRAIHWLDLSLTTGFSHASAETQLSVSTLFDPGPGLRPSLGRDASEKEVELAQLRKAAYDADIASCLDSELSRNALDRPAVRSF